MGLNTTTYNTIAQLLKLKRKKKISCDPRKLEDFTLGKHEGYKEQYAYVIFICRAKVGYGWYPADARVVKTYQTLNKIAKKKGFRILLHPQPVRIPEGFWKKWREAKSARERLKLAKELTRDENIFVLTAIALDWDSPYEECEPVFLELVEKLGARGWECGKTKSGNFRAVIYLEPLRVEKKNQPMRTFYLRPHTKGRNRHTHLQNFREVVAILNAYAQRKGIKADDSFKRVNHPVWYGKRFYQRVRKVHGETKLYDLYRKAKKLQKEEELWETNKRVWKPAEKKTAKKSGKLPKGGDIQKWWQAAVRKLAEKHNSYRFTRVILPAVSWAVWLGLSRWEVDEYLKKLLRDKRNFDEDIEKAWKYAKPATFEWGGRRTTGRNAELKAKLKEMLKMIEKYGEVDRQTILRDVFGGRNWELQAVERYALGKGYISVEKKKLTQGRGRKSYVYSLTEAGKKALRDKGRKKSIYKTPPSGEQEDTIVSSGLVEDGEKGFKGDRECRGTRKKEAIVSVGRVELPEVAPPTHLAAAELELQKELERELRKAEERKWKKKAWELIEKIERIWELRVGYVPDTKAYIRLVFGAVDSARRGVQKTYDLARWGSFSPALERVLRELGHEVREKEEPTPIFTDFQPNLPMPSGSSRGDDDDGIEELLDF